MIAPTPPNEEARLAALRACGVLDTAPELAFDDITLLAAQICGVPVAAISLIDECRQWFKSVVGLDVPETPRDIAFCAHTILQPELMVVPDAEADPRFAENPLVTGDQHIRFYAGAPLITPEGHALGSLCVLDRMPRTLTPEQRSALAALGRQVAGQIALRRAVAERDQAQAALREYAGRFETAVAAMQDGLVVLDADGAVRVCNAAAERILGETADQIMGRTPRDPRWRVIREDGGDFPVEEWPALRSLGTGESLRGVLMGLYRTDTDLAWVSVNSAPLIHPGAARPHGVVVTFEDVTEKKAAADAQGRLAAIMNSSRDAITATTLDGVIVAWSPGAERVYGYTADEMVGNHAGVLAGPDQASPVPGIIARLLGGEDVPPVEVVRRRKDGRTIDVLLTFTPIRDASGALVGVAGIGRDITAQKQAEAALLRERQFLAALLESLSEGIVACDADGTLSLFNSATRRFHGLPEQPLTPERWAEHFDLFHADGVTPLPTSEIPLFRAFQGEVVRDAEMVIAPKQGVPRALLASGQAIHDPQGRKLGAVVAMHDITERKAMEQALRESRRFAQSLTDHSTSIVFVFDLDTRSNIYSNRNVAEFLGYSVEQVAEMGGDLLPRILHPDDLARVQAHFGEFADKRDGEVVEIEYRVRHVSGEWHWIWNREVVFERDAAGRPRRILGTAQDITERKRSEQAVRLAEMQVRDYAVVLEAKMLELEAANGELERLATTDGLTGLRNNRAFRERLTQEFRRAVRYGTPLSLLLLDVDHFKQYNDSCGHVAGDAVLRQVAVLIGGCVRATDLAARYGGEEFVVVLPQTDAEGALVIAERIRVAVAAAPWDLRPVTASIGVAALGLDTPDPDALVVCADDALYRSKAAGRNQVTPHREPGPAAGA